MHEKIKSDGWKWLLAAVCIAALYGVSRGVSSKPPPAASADSAGIVPKDLQGTWGIIAYMKNETAPEVPRSGETLLLTGNSVVIDSREDVLHAGRVTVAYDTILTGEYSYHISRLKPEFISVTQWRLNEAGTTTRMWRVLARPGIETREKLYWLRWPLLREAGGEWADVDINGAGNGLFVDAADVFRSKQVAGTVGDAMSAFERALARPGSWQERKGDDVPDFDWSEVRGRSYEYGLGNTIVACFVAPLHSELPVERLSVWMMSDSEDIGKSWPHTIPSDVAAVALPGASGSLDVLYRLAAADLRERDYSHQSVVVHPYRMRYSVQGNIFQLSIEMMN